MQFLLALLLGTALGHPTTIVEVEETDDFIQLREKHSLFCTQKCASSLRTGVLAALGTHSTPYSSLLAPFHHIFSNTENTGHSLRKSEYTCRSVFNFDNCLSSCGSSPERDTWLQAISHWTLFCTLIKQSSKAVIEYVQCESEHMREAVKHCGHLNIYPRSSFTIFCRQFDKYHRCYQKLKHNCTEPGHAIKQQIDDAVQKTFERLMKLNSNRNEGLPLKSTPHRSADSQIVHQIPVLREVPTESPSNSEPTTVEVDLITAH
ncbi:unnamed protein product, partial [Mesorhabditis belari]|uniref:Uncharacterized protein n=1 Tax=Mesorhabditis belari TaxID=2138241 RepID=A0AAF3F2V6_9BILA